MSLEQGLEEDQKIDWIEDHYGDVKPEENKEEPPNPKIQEAIYFVAHHNWAECRLTFLELRCLKIKSLMEKFSIETKDESLLTQSLLQELKGYYEFDHPTEGPILIPHV